jgi:transcriptional regulator with GAF, ATPase, and Fis domain
MDMKFLPAISHELSSVKTRKQLLKVINDGLKKELRFDHSTLFLLNKCRTAVDDFFLDPETVIRGNPFCESIPLRKHPADEKGYNFDEISATRNFLPYVKDGRGPGKGWLFNLREGNLVIGHWVLLYRANILEDDRSDPDLMGLLANHLSIVVSKIMSDDAIGKREMESEAIQSLNIDFVSIRDKNDLLKVIHVRLKKLFDFGHHWVAVINEDQSTMTAFLVEPESRAKDHPKYQHVIKAKYPINDGIFNKALLSKEPQVFDLDQLSTRSDMPEYIQMLYESGIRKIVIIGLQVGDRIIGVWAICQVCNQQMSFNQLDLVKGISYQLSTAVSNILANEEIARREKERELLLSLSIDFAAVRNTNELLLVITRRLKNLLGFSHITIATINEDHVTASAFLLDPGSKSKTHPTYQDIINAKHPLNDGILDRIVASPSPIVVDLDRLNKESELPTWLKINFESGIRQLLAIRFSKGPCVFGFWLIYFEKKIPMEESRLHLTESLANQISVAVSNVIANDKIETQLLEIKRYKQQLEEEKIYLKEEIETTHNHSEIVGDSSAMQKTFRLVSQVAPSDSTVLLLGETGTGKELIARAIHNSSPRRHKLMVKVNCAALPANLVESELFGHERGSFTGATDRRLGKFELANGGTLFLDEIGEMPLELQVKLLRALQEREIERVGGRSTIRVDVRIIAATNRDLEKEMWEGRFRRDLYYRLNIFPISLPPLRDRREDIPQLACHFIQRFAKKAGRNIIALNNSALQELIQYNWPGNIRELEHLIERSILQAPGNTIKHIHLPQPRQSLIPASSKESFVVRTIDENERDFIIKTLKYCSGRIAGEGGAAQLLGVPPSTLNSKIKRLGIRREHIC